MAEKQNPADIWIEPLPEDWPKAHKQKVVYIAGPITGRPDYRYEFFAAEKAIWERGDIALNPASLPQGMSQRQYMRICLAMLDCADEVWYLPGWEESRGASIEHSYAEYVGIKEADKDGEPVGQSGAEKAVDV